MEHLYQTDASTPAADRSCVTCRFWLGHLPEFVQGECRLHAPSFHGLRGSPTPVLLTASRGSCAFWRVVRVVRSEPPAA